MSRLRELMKELCPDGVEYKKLGEIAHYAKTRINICNIEIHNYVGVEHLRQNKEGRIQSLSLPDSDSVIEFCTDDILIGNIRPYLKKIWLADCNGGTNGDVLTIRLNKGRGILPRYLFYVLSSECFFAYDMKYAKGAKMPRGDKKAVMNYEIPVPPLEIQNEIVKLLDNFTELTAELTEQLMTELTLRKKQYNFYRDSLLNFVRVDDTIVQTDRQTDRQVQRISKFGRRIQKDIVWRTLGDIGTVCMCKRILKQQTNTESGIPFYKIGTFGKAADSYISEELFEEYKAKYSYPRKGEILISAAGTIGRTVIYDGTPAYFQDSNIVWIANDESVVLNRYLYYFYSLFPWSVAEGGTVARLYNDQIRRTEIPVPPLEVQRKIVSILDRFDTLCNDLTSGLPAEIAARKKQYEHYRDKLLTFPRSKLEERS